MTPGIYGAGRLLSGFYKVISNMTCIANSSGQNKPIANDVLWSKWGKQNWKAVGSIFQLWIMNYVCSGFLFFVGTEDIQMNLEPGARHVMVIWTLMTFNAMKNICKDSDRWGIIYHSGRCACSKLFKLNKNSFKTVNHSSL